MANIKFYRAGNSYWDNKTPLEGYIWFNTDDRTISIYKEGNWEKYSGIVSASYSENILTITPAAGNPIVVDLTDLGKINTIQTALATVINQLKHIEEKEGAVKEYIDDKVDGKFDTVGSAAQALTDAKQYTDDEIGKLSFDEAGTAKTLADQALADAKADAASLYQVKGDYEAAGTAAGLNEAMDARVKVLEERDVYVKTDVDKQITDAAAAAVATVLDGAPDAFNTLQEVAEWIADNDHAEDVATLVTDVADLKAIDHDAYKGADNALRTELQSYADQAEADALSAAKSYTDNAVLTINTTIEENELVTAEALTDLDSRITALASGTVTSVTGTNYITATTTDDAVTVSATTGTVANGDEALALASDVKQYVDGCWTWGEF